MPRVSEFVQLHALPAFFANGRFARELPFAPALPIRQEIAHKQSDQKNGARVSGLSDSKPELENVEQLDELSEGSTLAFDLG